MACSGTPPATCSPALTGSRLQPRPNIHLPEPAEVAGRQLDRALHQFLRAGITTVVMRRSAGARRKPMSPRATAGRLDLRVNMMVISAFLEEALQLGLVRAPGRRLARVQAASKLYADWRARRVDRVFSRRLCGRARQPRPSSITSPESSGALMRRAHRAGLQNRHACAVPTAIGIVLDAVEAAQRELPRPDMRHAIEHSGLATDEQIARMARARHGSGHAATASSAVR